MRLQIPVLSLARVPGKRTMKRFQWRLELEYKTHRFLPSIVNWN